MSSRWAPPVWGEPSAAAAASVPLRPSSVAANAAFRADGGSSTDFIVVAASVCGTAHRLAGRRCEDSYGWAQPGPGRLALAVADGVSGAGRGGEGADLAVSTACSLLSDQPDGAPWGPAGAVRAVTGVGEALAAAAGPHPAASLSTTLVVALLSAQEEGMAIALARVGDSTAFALSAGGEWRELFAEAPPAPGPPGAPGDDGPDDGPDDGLRSTATDALPLASGAAAATAIGTWSGQLPGGAALVLVTDGLAGPLRDGPSTVAPGLAEALLRTTREGPSPLDLVHAASFSRRGVHDDRTIVAAWRPPALAAPVRP